MTIIGMFAFIDKEFEFQTLSIWEDETGQIRMDGDKYARYAFLSSQEAQNELYWTFPPQRPNN